MVDKSWWITALPLLIGLSFTTITFVTDVELNETHVQLLDWLLYAFLGSGAAGVANAAHKRYIKYKSKP